MKMSIISQSVFNSSFERGGVLVRVAVACATLIVIGGAIIGTISSFQQKQQVYHRKALAISEYGLLMAFQKLQDEPSWVDGIEKTSYEDGWFTVKTRQYLQGDTIFLSIRSEGWYKSVSEAREFLLRLQNSEDDSIWVRHSMY